MKIVKSLYWDVFIERGAEKRDADKFLSIMPTARALDEKWLFDN